MEQTRPLPPKHEDKGGASVIRLLRRPPVGQRDAGHPSRDGKDDQGRVLPLQDDEGLPRPPQSRLGHARAARRAGCREDPGHNQGGHRTEDKRGGIQRDVPQGGDEVHQGMVGPDGQDGLLGRSGQPVHHLRQPLHRDTVVAVEATVRQGTALQGLHHPALFAGGGHGAQFARAQPAGLLPRRQGHDGHGTVPHHHAEGRDDAVGQTLLPGMDDDTVDIAVKHCAVRRTED